MTLYTLTLRTNLEHFLKSIIYILYIVSKLGKSGVQRFKQCTNWSWNEEVIAVWRQLRKVERIELRKFHRVFRSCETPLWHTSAISLLHPLISQLRNGLQNGLKKYSLATKWPRNHHFATKSPPSYDSSCKSSSSCGITSKLKNQSSNLQNG